MQINIAAKLDKKNRSMTGHFEKRAEDQGEQQIGSIISPDFGIRKNDQFLNIEENNKEPRK